MSRNEGVAMILSLVIVSVLFIFTSFLIRSVVTNTKIIRKAEEEETGYALAKAGILYAINQLNTSEGFPPPYHPPYEPTEWPGNSDWNDYNLDNDTNTGDSSGNDVSLRVRKENPGPNYITIESKDLPKKLVTLEGIADSKSPLLKYIRFIASQVSFGNNMFGSSSSSAICQGEAPLCIMDNLIWKSGSSNNLIITGNNKALILGRIINQGVTSLLINNSSADSGHYYFFDPDNPAYNNPDQFDTAQGCYFSIAHLPSCYDYSGGSTNFYYGGPQSIFWPQINETRYRNLADLLVSASDCGKRGSTWNDWYPSDNKYPGSYISGNYWRREGISSSYNYTPPAVHLIFSSMQDLDPSTSATTERLMQIKDDDSTDLPAEYETSASISYSSFASDDVIFCEKDVRLNGVLPHNLTIVSGGNIYIDSNIYTNGYSLALLAKENVLLNTTHRWVAGYEGDSWNDNGTSAANLAGVTDGENARAQVNIGESKEQILNFGGSTSAQIVTTNQIILRGCAYWVGEDNTLNFSAEVDLGGENWQPLTITAGPTFPINGPDDSGPDPLTITLEVPSNFRNFSRIKLTLTGGGTGTEPAGWIEIDAVEILITGINKTVIFAENGSWYVIAGNGASANNDQQESFTLNVALSEKNLEDMSKWNGSNPQEATWDKIIYTYDSSIASTLALPPSVNLISLRRSKF